MCISLPAKICSIRGRAAEVETYEVRRTVLLHVESARPGDWVIVHSGIAVAIISTEEANETFELIGKLNKPVENRK